MAKQVKYAVTNNEGMVFIFIIMKEESEITPTRTILTTTGISLRCNMYRYDSYQSDKMRISLSGISIQMINIKHYLQI